VKFAFGKFDDGGAFETCMHDLALPQLQQLHARPTDSQSKQDLALVSLGGNGLGKESSGDLMSLASRQQAHSATAARPSASGTFETRRLALLAGTDSNSGAGVGGRGLNRGPQSSDAVHFSRKQVQFRSGGRQISAPQEVLHSCNSDDLVELGEELDLEVFAEVCLPHSPVPKLLLRQPSPALPKRATLAVAAVAEEAAVTAAAEEASATASAWMAAQEAAAPCPSITTPAAC
jgi:hypothetical protein